MSSASKSVCVVSSDGGPRSWVVGARGFSLIFGFGFGVGGDAAGSPLDGNGELKAAAVLVENGRRDRGPRIRAGQHGIRIEPAKHSRFDRIRLENEDDDEAGGSVAERSARRRSADGARIAQRQSLLFFSSAVEGLQISQETSRAF